MPKYIAVIEDNAEVIEAKDRDEANRIAYKMWRGQVDENWYTEEATKENLENWGLEETRAKTKDPAACAELRRTVSGRLVLAVSRAHRVEGVRAKGANV